MFKKDYHSELRTRYAINALVMFVVTTLSVVLFSIGNESVSTEVLAGVLWVIIFFSTMSGLARTFVSEEERGTVLTLHLIARPLTIYYGKLLFNTILLTIINAFTVILYLLTMTGFTIGHYGIFVLTMFLGTIGLSLASTILAAMIAKANTRGTLFPVICFPVLLPLLLTVISATKLAMEATTFLEAEGFFRILFSYIIVMFVISYLLFEFIWKD